jgi:3-oxoacyl-[acyl-carrier protein] reductase
MVKNKSGKIINISSVWGNVGASCEVAYSASKGGMNAFTKALAKELAPSNVQVNAVACGAIDTEMNQWLEDTELMSLIEEIPANGSAVRKR